MEKSEREWVAMLLAELKHVGMGDISDHYRTVLVAMDSLLGKEYEACMTMFRGIERERRRNAGERNSKEGCCLPPGQRR